MPEAKGRQSQILCGRVCLCLSEHTGLILFKWQAKVWGRSRREAVSCLDIHVPRGWRTGFYWEGGSPAITIILHCYGGVNGET